MTSWPYQGDELALPQVEVAPADRRDPVWTRSGGTSVGRDGARVPMPWSGDAPPYGFSADGVRPWLPQPADWAARTVLAQAADPMSTWLLVRGALTLRRSLPHLRGDKLRWRDDVPAGCLAFDRLPPASGAEPGSASASGHTAGTATSVGPSGMTCVMATDGPVRLAISGRLALASGPVGYDGATLDLPADTTVWVAPPAP